ncbi:2-oxoglutarate dehydrogenase E1 component [Buchnera aphidicola]|uniref:oxoglutarate dehydrogenase (succinyl-transferring) n=1 Tax=Buchnera aphidicola (Therioaphis trifolii) TaxID=1241884 RepID=A0A4D6YG81_9GAMM|nr:2-oxoglutarate dehydrogenase E1 component [Buchnera aphidicola]QCI27203.1 2-oxoglutarate dehydrogenase E1 component [Buchnera aphidicola (Therioaphis trifolii)]
MKKEINNKFFKCSSLNQLYIEKIYQKFIKNPNLVSVYWKKFFKNNEHDFENINLLQINNEKNVFQYEKLKILKFIKYIRKYGHQYSNTNPLKNVLTKDKLYSLIFNDFCLRNDDINNIDSIFKKNNNFKKIYLKFTNIYCQSIGIEYMHISNINEKKWLQKYIEKKKLEFQIPKKKQKKILKQLIKSEVFEKYLHAKFPGSKRFSLEGCEVLISLLKEIIYYTYNKITKKIIIGMAHRGRLNVLVNILNKNISDLCNEFSEKYKISYGTGDAKYHLGMTSQIKIKDKIIEIDLKSNPSHLEIINPVVMGSSRAYIDQCQLKDTNCILPINIHGDAAIIGQGVNQELLNMSQTRNYFIGGILHIVINNQIGFTTSNIKDIRSSQYCTDIAKMIQSPVFHVNADDPEAVIFVTKLALDFKYKFKKDVFIDLICYRRRGHNEADEPSVTQPLMYKKIKQHKTICQIYHKYLMSEIQLDSNYLNNEIEKQRNKLNRLTFIKKINHNNLNIFINKKKYILKEDLELLFKKINYIPKFINLHERVLKIYKERQNMILNDQLFDWGSLETLAYANILSQGISCRLSGEDVGRGTFFHRHAIVYDQKNGSSYIPLNHLKKNQGKFYICNSVLSEEAVLAFEYGYSIDSKNTINIWEAQFGDFFNGAQIVIDQFISSGEQKWGIKSKLIMLLPHGYEGQGPEHSSARLERFLQLSSQNNIKICIPSTSAQMYHILIHQSFCENIKPLIILTPKSLLRNPMTYSNFLEIKNGKFYKIIDEIKNFKKNNIKKIIFCSGKIYYDLFNERENQKIKNIILIRIEQLYPFPKYEILKLINFYKNKQFYWCQEEPKNQGAWYYMYHKFKKIIPNNTLKYIGRTSSAAPAVGCLCVHKNQQKKIIFDALNV